MRASLKTFNTNDMKSIVDTYSLNPISNGPSARPLHLGSDAADAACVWNQVVQCKYSFKQLNGDVVA